MKVGAFRTECRNSVSVMIDPWIYTGGVWTTDRQVKLLCQCCVLHRFAFRRAIKIYKKKRRREREDTALGICDWQVYWGASFCASVTKRHNPVFVVPMCSHHWPETHLAWLLMSNYRLSVGDTLSHPFRNADSAVRHRYVRHTLSLCQNSYIQRWNSFTGR